MSQYGTNLVVGDLDDDEVMEMLAYNLKLSEREIAERDGEVRWAKPPEFGFGTVDEMPAAFRRAAMEAKGNLKIDRLQQGVRYAWWYAEREAA